MFFEQTSIFWCFKNHIFEQWVTNMRILGKAYALYSILAFTFVKFPSLASFVVVTEYLFSSRSKIRTSHFCATKFKPFNIFGSFMAPRGIKRPL